MEKDEIEDVLQANIEEYLNNAECFEEEDSNSRESLSLAEYAFYAFYNIFKIFHFRQYFSYRMKIRYFSGCYRGLQLFILGNIRQFGPFI